jgi:hypothetical protein
MVVDATLHEVAVMHMPAAPRSVAATLLVGDASCQLYEDGMPKRVIVRNVGLHLGERLDDAAELHGASSMAAWLGAHGFAACASETELAVSLALCGNELSNAHLAFNVSTKLVAQAKSLAQELRDGGDAWRRRAAVRPPRPRHAPPKPPASTSAQAAVDMMGAALAEPLSAGAPGSAPSPSSPTAAIRDDYIAPPPDAELAWQVCDARVSVAVDTGGGSELRVEGLFSLSAGGGCYVFTAARLHGEHCGVAARGGERRVLAAPELRCRLERRLGEADWRLRLALQPATLRLDAQLVSALAATFAVPENLAAWELLEDGAAEAEAAAAAAAWVSVAIEAWSLTFSFSPRASAVPAVGELSLAALLSLVRVSGARLHFSQVDLAAVPAAELAAAVVSTLAADVQSTQMLALAAACVAPLRVRRAASRALAGWQPPGGGSWKRRARRGVNGLLAGLFAERGSPA